MGLRRKARELAVQTLYALDYSEVNEEFREFSLLNAYPEILAEMAVHDGVDVENQAYAFAEDLIKNTIINLEEIEKRLENLSSNWSLERIVHLDLSILRIAIYEMVFTDTPVPVVINEAIEIAKKYSSESSSKYVNGILDSLHQQLKFAKLTPQN